MGSNQLEIAERAIVYLAQALAHEEPDYAALMDETDPHKKRAMMEEWEQAQILRQEHLIRMAKLQAMESMGILPGVNDAQ